MRFLKTLALSLAATAAFSLPAMAQYGHHRGQGEATLYARPNFTGASVRVTGPVPRLAALRFNDKASSIRITGGAWEVCEDANYQGRCEIIEWRENSLNEMALNNSITSIRPIEPRGRGWGRGDRWDRGDRYDRDDRWGRDDRWDRDDRWGRDQRPGRVVRPNYNAPAVLFEHDDFGGAAYPVTAAIPHLNRVRFNDQVSSILINSGRWEVCTDPNFRGRCEIIDADVTSLGYYRLNDNITSIRPAGTGPGRPW